MAQGEVVVICRNNHTVAELRSVENSVARRTRIAGLLKDQVGWAIDAFAPMTEEELDAFDGSRIFPG